MKGDRNLPLMGEEVTGYAGTIGSNIYQDNMPVMVTQPDPESQTVSIGRSGTISREIGKVVKKLYRRRT